MVPSASNCKCAIYLLTKRLIRVSEAPDAGINIKLKGGGAKQPASEVSGVLQSSSTIFRTLDAVGGTIYDYQQLGVVLLFRNNTPPW